MLRKKIYFWTFFTILIYILYMSLEYQIHELTVRMQEVEHLLEVEAKIISLLISKKL